MGRVGTIRDVKRMLALDAEIAALQKKQRALYESIDGWKPPAKLRPMMPEDVKVGQIYWGHVDDPEECYWNEIAEIIGRPDDEFKAWCAADGCRYGIWEKWVQV